MNPNAWIAICGLVITLLLFLIPIIYFAGKMVAKLETVIGRLSNLEGQMASFKDNCFTKVEAGVRMGETDKNRDAMWKKIDKLAGQVTKLFIKQGMNPDDEK